MLIVKAHVLSDENKQIEEERLVWSKESEIAKGLSSERETQNQPPLYWGS